MSALSGIGASLRRARHAAGRAFLWAEDKPMVVILVSAGATAGVSVLLASYAGWPHVLHLIYTRHSWIWLVVCLAGELIAYGGYVLTVRDMARIDGGQEMDFELSAEAVVGGFGVFAATRASGGFAVDYWAFRRPAPAGARRWPGRSASGCSSTRSSRSALARLALPCFDLDGHAGNCDDSAVTADPPLLRARALGDVAEARQPVEPAASAGSLTRTLADSSPAQDVRDLLLSPREHGAGRPRKRRLLGGRHPLPVGRAADRRRQLRSRRSCSPTRAATC